MQRYPGKLIGGCIAVILIFFWLLTFIPGTAQPKIYLDNQTISLIVVDTPATRELGLSGRESLSDNTAMLFVFDKPDRYGIWMKDMKFPLDIVWLDENFKIVHIETNVSPQTYPNSFRPPQNSLYVLEFRAHVTEGNHLKIGDVLDLRLKK